ncbi:cell wall-active antibiotics response protein LiaF [Lapidilactobacillus wuchangensis]|uniref:cell wall-active antibiotics response protein LiaF n=1 Tax=Lapidilactobacillus wuchangensis TaxID=2486001 RepID=UPI000F789C53|nr:cell wall-active antibiotics response protein LiaF [Lapidilactobacillus wuchangensis]
MRKFLPFFGIVLIGCLILLGWQVFSTPAALIFFILGILMLLLQNRRHQQGRKVSNFMRLVAVLAIVISLASQGSFWLFLFVVLLGLVLFAPTSIGHGGHFFWQKKKYLAPQVTTAAENNLNVQVEKNQWWGDQTIGNQVYQWQDINLKELGGDTIIDLGNTLLPVDRENVVILQKGFGDTRILVPFGTGVYLEHATFLGEVRISGQRHELKNQTFRLKSPEYLKSERRIRIVTSCLLGDLEVVYV